MIAFSRSTSCPTVLFFKLLIRHVDLTYKPKVFSLILQTNELPQSSTAGNRSTKPFHSIIQKVSDLTIAPYHRFLPEFDQVASVIPSPIPSGLRYFKSPQSCNLRNFKTTKSEISRKSNLRPGTKPQNPSLHPRHLSVILAPFCDFSLPSKKLNFFFWYLLNPRFHRIFLRPPPVQIILLLYYLDNPRTTFHLLFLIFFN